MMADDTYEFPAGSIRADSSINWYPPDRTSEKEAAKAEQQRINRNQFLYMQRLQLREQGIVLLENGHAIQIIREPDTIVS